MHRIYCVALSATLFLLSPMARAQDTPHTAEELMRLPGHCVFFNINDTSVTQDGQDVVQQAAQQAMAGGATTITVTGHANLVEAHMDVQQNNAGPENAQAVSVGRAEAVKKALYASGVPASVTIDAVGVGATSPLMTEQLSDHDKAALVAPSDDFDRGALSGEVFNRAACIAF